MEIHVDYNPTPKEDYFISIPIGKGELISFDKTLKGHRIVKQVYRETKPCPTDTVFDSEWDVVVLDDSKFVRKYHVKWVDQGNLDWLNGEIWETVWEKPISEELSGELLRYSQVISDNYKNLDKVKGDIEELEKIIESEISKVRQKG